MPKTHNFKNERFFYFSLQTIFNKVENGQKCKDIYQLFQKLFCLISSCSKFPRYAGKIV